MNWSEIIERVLAVIGALNVLTVVVMLVCLLFADPNESYPKRITREKFDRVTRRGRML